MSGTNDAVVVEKVEPVAPVVDAEVNGSSVVAEDFDYEKEFEAQVAKRETEKAENNGEQQQSAPTDPAAETTDEPQTEADDAAAKPVVDTPAVDVKKEVKEPTRAEILASLPEAAQKAAQAAFDAADAAEKRATTAEHDARSQAGRVAAFQRKYEEAAGKKPVDVVKAATAEQTAKWKAFAEQYPEVAEAMEARIAEANPGIAANVEQMAKFVEGEMQSRRLNEASEAVDAVHPGFAAVVKTKEFQTWQATSQAYERLASSDDVEDAIALMDLWKLSRPAAAPAPVVDPKIAADAAKLAAKRGAQVEGGKAAVTGTAAPNAIVDPNDPDQMWNFYASKSNNRMNRRNAR